MKINRTANKAFEDFRNKAIANGEDNDCTVRAVSTITGLDYEVVLEASYRHGRKKGKGMFTDQVLRMIESLGFNVLGIHPKALISLYPSPHNNLGSVTSHHPQRFANVWPSGVRLLFRKNGHMWGVAKGKNTDWTEGRACRAKQIWVIFPKGDDTAKSAFIKARQNFNEARMVINAKPEDLKAKAQTLFKLASAAWK